MHLNDQDEFIQIGPDESTESFFARRRDIASITVTADDGVMIDYHVNGTVHQFGLGNLDANDLLHTLNGTAPPPPPAPRYDVLEITHMQRSEYRAGYLMPVWDCYTEDGRRIEIIDKPDINAHTFHLTRGTGYEQAFDNLLIDHTHYFDEPMRVVVETSVGAFTPIAIVPKPPAPKSVPATSDDSDDGDDDLPPAAATPDTATEPDTGTDNRAIPEIKMKPAPSAVRDTFDIDAAPVPDDPDFVAAFFATLSEQTA